MSDVLPSSRIPERRHADPIAYPPRGMNREEAARYVGVGTTKFDELVHSNRMPKGKRVGGRVIWDRFTLDLAFNDLDDAGNNSIDALMGK